MLTLLKSLDPRRLIKVLKELDQEACGSNQDRSQIQLQAALTLLFIAVCLLIIFYLKLASSFQFTLNNFSILLGKEQNFLLHRLHSTGFGNLLAEIWWGFWHLVGYVLLPWLYIHFVLKQPISNFGLGFGSLKQHWKWYLVLLVPILVFVVLASFRDDFIDHYPFYQLANRSWFDLLAWEIIYLSQFVFLEFFFRGFILQSLRPAFGVNAIFIMCIPYLMIHFSKPWLEASGAILFGLFLGVLAMRSRSIWGGVAVHAGVAASMDIAALLQSRGLPIKWWPI
jgi:membrane protease YdiL (CAAX protease family)